LFTSYFVWSAGKILKLTRLLRYRDGAYLKAVTDHERLTAHFQSLRDEVDVKNREVTATFNTLLTEVARLKASQTNQAVN
jgi:hypothetical protein